MNMKGCGLNPDIKTAGNTAEGPGKTSVSIPSSMACFSNIHPGSETPGVPASEITAIFSPSRNFSNRKFNFSFSL